MRAKMYNSNSVEPYVRRLESHGYRVRYELDTDGIHYYSVQIYSAPYYNFVGEYSTPRKACEALCSRAY